MDNHYFKHDYYARLDDKLKRLRIKHGLKGIGAFWCITEMLYENEGRLENDYDIIADELRCDAEFIQSVINDFGLFELSEDKIINRRVNEQLTQLMNKSKKAKESIQKRWKNRNQNEQQQELQFEEESYTNVKENDTNVSENDTNVQTNTHNINTIVTRNDTNVIRENENVLRPNYDRNTDKIREDKIREDKIKNNSLSVSLSQKNGGEATERERSFDNIFFIFFSMNRKKPSDEARKFIDFYEAQGWKRNGGQKITNVAAAVRMWKCDDDKPRFRDKRYLDCLVQLAELVEGPKHEFLENIKDFRRIDGYEEITCIRRIALWVEDNEKAQEIIKRTLSKEGEEFKLRYILTDEN